jgi:hypothetical protein
MLGRTHLDQLAGQWVLLYTTITIIVRRHQQQMVVVKHS